LYLEMAEVNTIATAQVWEAFPVIGDVDRG